MFENGFFLITGTSKGIGRALAQALVGEGHTVLGAARGAAAIAESGNYHHRQADLTDMASVRGLADEAARLVGRGHFDFLCLVNNAAVLEPLKPLHRCTAEEIESHVEIGLIAPMVLTSAFVRLFEGEQVRKKVVFMSSGAATSPLPDMSVYCATKAAINMLAKCVGLEHAGRARGFEVMAISPGMVETSMQQTARAKSEVEFAMGDMFRQAHESGQVQEPAEVARKIVKAIGRKYTAGQCVSLSDI